MKKTKKITAILVLGLVPLLSANAAGVREVATGLFVPDYSSQELISKGCEPTNWNKLVSDYVAVRTTEKMLAKAQTDQIIRNAPTAQGGGTAGRAGACFQNAMSQIDSVTNTANQVLSIFNGGFNWGALAGNLANQFATQACQQVDYVVGSQVNRILAPVTGTIGAGQQVIGGIGGINVGGVNVGGAAIGSIIPSPTPYQMPYTGSVGNATGGNASGGNASVGFFSRMNPFRSNSPTVPDPLK